uniref:Zinc-finger domain-containing protein n=1 Tax=Strigamia maritima TaxID=126957 RepID=T1J8D1_STRMM
MAQHQLSPYEQMVEENIKRKNAMLNEFLKEVNQFMVDENIPAKKKFAPKKAYKKRDFYLGNLRDYSPPRTRSRSGSAASSIQSSPYTPKTKINSKFGKKTNTGSSEEISEDDEHEKTTKRKRLTFSHQYDREIIPVEDVTDSMLKKIAKNSSHKTYNSSTGSCCHQCRQKTVDTKTVCRSKECFGIRGQFCGPCLTNRYGESVEDALLNPLWSCPPCRGICNCSFCRQKDGYNSTGILIHEAKHFGYKSGSSCHQCRQKTLDTKTNCRSSRCIGVRGQFCGPCLRNRYGQGVKESLIDPDWICPPCRGICNCSFCRARQGSTCTGIMIHEAKQYGFNSVSEYLASVEKKSSIKSKD